MQSCLTLDGDFTFSLTVFLQTQFLLKKKRKILSVIAGEGFWGRQDGKKICKNVSVIGEDKNAFLQRRVFKNKICTNANHDVKKVCYQAFWFCWSSRGNGFVTVACDARVAVLSQVDSEACR